MMAANNSRSANEQPPMRTGTASPGPSAPMRYLLVVIAAILGLAAYSLLLKPMIFPPVKQRNIILIVADALRTDHLGCYGYDRPLSPNIDFLASGGTLFTNCNTVVPSTLASFTSLFTSRHPKDHGASRNGFQPLDGFPTLAGALSAGGYETAAFVSSYSIHSDFGTSRGFEHFDEHMTQSTILFDNKLIRSANEVTDAFLHWLSQREEDRPFFAMIHYFDPHFPYRPPEWLLRPPVIREGDGAKRVRATMRDISNAIKILRESGGVPDEYVRTLHDLYCAEIRYMDEHIGRVIDRFRSVGSEADDTVIIFTADHGETFWEHAEYFGHGETVFETGIRIPLIFNCPGFVPAGVRHAAPLSNLDLAPTLCRLAGAVIPGAFAGESFLDLVTGAGPPEGRSVPDPARLRFSEGTKPYKAEEDAPRPNLFKAKSVRRGPWKYIEVPHAGEGGALYNLDEDPAELTDLAGLEVHAALVRALQAELKRWAADYDPERSGGRTLDPDVQKRLEGLGY